MSSRPSAPKSATSSRPSRRAAATATFSPGNEPENPAAMTSPGPMPAAAICRVSTAAHTGLAEVRLASRLPKEVVMTERSRPMSPVPFRSVARSTGTPAATRQSLTARVARAIRREASSISGRAAAAGSGRNRTQRR